MNKIERGFAVRPLRSVKSLLVATLIVFLSISLYGAYLVNVPQTLRQPDGVILNCFASGDEFYHWLHDADDYTIIADPKTGFFVYAIKNAKGDLEPSPYIAGRVDPKALGLEKGVRLPARTIESRRVAHIEGIESAPAPKTGTLNNVVIFIRFSGESEFTNNISGYDTNFNSSSAGVNSMHNYFNEASYTVLNTITRFYPDRTGSTVVSYQDSQPRNYYQLYNASTNPNGYDDSDPDITKGSTYREHTLLKNAVNSCSSQITADGFNLDGDGDGLVDNVCFIVFGYSDGWSDLLWPHMWSLYSQNAFIGTKRVYTYNFQLNSTSGPGPSVLCHEMGHSLGAPDLYRYSDKTITPVGIYDLMSNNLTTPQHMGAYMKWKYMTWISAIPTITTTGTYTLNPLTSATGNCYKIASPNSTTQYFVVEFRKAVGFDAYMCGLYGTGLLIYRINTLYGGNANGPPDEVYIYRTNGRLTVDGTYTDAMFSSEKGRTSINDGTEPPSFLSTGGAGGLNISNIGSSAGSTMSFYVSIPGSAVVPTVTTTAASSITSTSAASGGNVTSDGGAAVTARGVCLSTSANPTIANAHTHDGTGTGAFTSSLTGCSSNMTYHIRAYATNSVGTAYGSDLTFTTSPGPPTVMTTATSLVGQTSFMSGGNVTWDGGAAVTARGVCVSTSANPTISSAHTHDGSGTGVFTSSLTGATPGTTYHVRAYATNTYGTSYGEDVWLRTIGGPKSDFNGDGQDDILWRNSATGENYVWFMGQAALGMPEIQMKEAPRMSGNAVANIARKDGRGLFEGKPPAIFLDFPSNDRPKNNASLASPLAAVEPKMPTDISRIPSQGIAASLALKGIGGDYLTAVADLNWEIVGTGYFNGDGKPDIVWRNSATGENYVWYMNGTTRIGGDPLAIVTDLNWKIVGTGDFNGDGMPDLLWRNSATGQNCLWFMSGVTRIGGDYLTAVADLNWKIGGTGDFNGDWKPDIIWRNSVTGENYVWYMNGVTRIGGDSLATVSDLNWGIGGTGDFNGDWKPDIVWRNAATAEAYVWYMNGVTRIGGDSLPIVADMKIEFVGTGDFNGDGKPDILWRSSVTGENYVWYMNGVIRIGGDSLPIVADLNWRIGGTGDFNGDGKPDILWRNSATGENYVWYMNGTTRIGGDSLTAVADLNWGIGGTGDFNGDGKPDILWRNSVTGENYIWYMNRVTRIGGGYLTTVSDLNWGIGGTGDFNGDGKSDIVWRNSVTGGNYVWYMSGVTRIGGDSLTTVTDLNWRIVGTGDFNGDGKTDIIWRHSVTGEHYAWYMSGVTRIGGDSFIQVFDTNWKIVNR